MLGFLDCPTVSRVFLLFEGVLHLIYSKGVNPIRIFASVVCSLSNKIINHHLDIFKFHVSTRTPVC